MKTTIITSLAFLVIAGVSNAETIDTQTGKSTTAPAASNDKEKFLAELYKNLLSAGNEKIAYEIGNKIMQIWAKEATPVSALLMEKGEREMAKGMYSEAEEDFDDVTALQPNFAEAFHHKAQAEASQGHYKNALADIEKTLILDPKNFMVFNTMSKIVEEMGDLDEAVKAWQKFLDYDPMFPDGIKRLDMLLKKRDGNDT